MTAGAGPASGPGSGVAPDAAEAVRLLAERGATVAVAESLTGGSVTSALVDVPGVSACLRGGVVAYATDLKAGLLDVPDGLLAARGAVHEDVALAMARGVRARLGSDVGVATTGVAGPEAQDGRPPGTFHVAVVTPEGEFLRSAGPAGPTDRARVRAAARDAALNLLVGALSAGTDGGGAALHRRDPREPPRP